MKPPKETRDDRIQRIENTLEAIYLVLQLHLRKTPREYQGSEVRKKKPHEQEFK